MSELSQHKNGIGRFGEGSHWEVDSRTGCWNWLRWKDRAGYGRCTEGRAHRVVWMASGRRLEKGEPLHHRCHNPSCVNPDHLEPTDAATHRQAHARFESSLSWDDVREIRRLHQEGLASTYQLVEQFGIGKSQIHHILANINWVDPDYTPGRKTTCDVCGEEFLATRVNQRFCCPAHRRLNDSRMQYARKVASR